MEGLEYLTDDERAYFSEFDALFASQGWTQLMREYENERNALPKDTFWEAKDWDELVMARVRLAVLLELEHYPEAVEHRKAAMIRERQQLVEEMTGEQTPAL